MKSFSRKSKSLFKKLKNNCRHHDFSSIYKIKGENIVFGKMLAKPKVCLVLQCRQITFKVRGQIFKKRTFIIIIIIILIITIQLLLLPLLLTTMMKWEKTVDAAPKTFSNPAPLFPSCITVWCTTYFKDALKRINRMKVMFAFLLICLCHLNKKLNKLSNAWNPAAPPWPLDQISIIWFKQYPYLKSFMLDICNEVLRTP